MQETVTVPCGDRRRRGRANAWRLDYATMARLTQALAETLAQLGPRH